MEQYDNVAVLVGAYTIGKERIFKGLLLDYMFIGVNLVNYCTFFNELFVCLVDIFFTYYPGPKEVSPLSFF